MNAPTRLAAYGAGLAVVLTGGLILGDRTDLGDVEAATAGHSTHSDEQEDAMSTSNVDLPGGLQVSQGGYTLDLADRTSDPGAQQVSFRIIGPDDQPVTEYDVAHEKQLHLIAVRRDFAGFQHVHPSLDVATGIWSVDLDLAPGSWRVFADFVPHGGEGLTLGSDLLVAGDPGRQAPPGPSRTATVDGYTVAVTGELAAGEHAMLEFEVTKDGEPVTDLQPYLGAYGHLVALREGDLAYLHVHPGGEPGDGVTEPGPVIEFSATAPSAGRYHLFLDFKVDGVVHTASFTLDAGTGSGDVTDQSGGSEGGGGDHGSEDHAH